MDKDDYYEYHESKEALAQGEMNDVDYEFCCPLSYAKPMKSACSYFKETCEKVNGGHVFEMDCTFPKGESNCPFPQEKKT